jgi:hypothetical protein
MGPVLKQSQGLPLPCRPACILFVIRAVNPSADLAYLGKPMVPFVDEARPQAQTGGKRHPGTDGAAWAAWP